MPGPGGHHAGGPGGRGGMGGPRGGMHHGHRPMGFGGHHGHRPPVPPPMFGGHHHHRPYQTGCCGCAVSVLALIIGGIAAILAILF